MRSKIFLLAILGFAFACSQDPSASDKNDEVTLDEYKASPLAILMRKMDADLQAARTAMLNGSEIPDSISFSYDAILTAEPTDPNVSGELFDNMANAFLFSMSEFRNAPAEEQHKLFNQSVNGCVNCHGQLCPGPLVRIRKLPIPE